jgi:hypothetical protein
MRRKGSHFLKHLRTRLSEYVKLAYLILMTKKFGVCCCPPETSLCIDHGDRICVGMKMQREVNGAGKPHC